MGGHRIFTADIATERFWQIAVLTAAGAIGLASQAEAARYYWPDYEPGFFQSRPAPTRSSGRSAFALVRPRRSRRRKDTAKPQGTVIIAISIEQQTLKVYDANGFFAETPISTGMKGHPTPMGVFSIIQKHKLHHSNIYSGAPMPFMQRITWSGIAMHAGVLPGYPASHGCIRMPMAFAAKMWNWTKMGARVVVTPGEITPAQFSHPLLAAQKVACRSRRPPSSLTRMRRRPRRPTSRRTPAWSSPRCRSRPRTAIVGRPQRGTRTADASGAASHPVTMSDASSSATNPRPERR